MNIGNVRARDLDESGDPVEPDPDTEPDSEPEPEPEPEPDPEPVPVPVPEQQMVLIPAGSFEMGDSFGGEYMARELPRHAVNVSAFLMDKYEVSRELWNGVAAWASLNGYDIDVDMSSKPGDHPVLNKRWYACVKWCNARSEMEGLEVCYYMTSEKTTPYRTGEVDVSNAAVDWSANGFRLPTEAEWEKAARGLLRLQATECYEGVRGAPRHALFGLPCGTTPGRIGLSMTTSDFGVSGDHRDLAIHPEVELNTEH